MPMPLTVASEPQNYSMQSSAALVHLAEMLPDGIVLFDSDWRLVYANQAARTISLIEDRHLHQTHWEIWPETVGTPLETTYRRAMADQREDHIPEFFHQRLSQCYDIHLLPIEGGLAVFYRDVTKEWGLRQARDEAEERTRLALSAANGIGIWDWHVLDDLVYADPQFAELYEVDPEQAAAGAPLDVFMRHVHPDDLALTSRAIETALRERGPYTAEYRILQSSGNTIWVAASGRCTHSPEGLPLRFSGVVVDISNRKRTEAALIRSEKLAAVGRMASSIAHEINNPLESVTNLIFIAQQHGVSSEVKRYLSLADQELRRINIIANQTLRFHKQAATPRPISADQLFATVLSLYEGRLRNSGIVVHKRLPPDLMFACFEGDIRQVLNNLVGNAIDAMPRGGVLHLRSRRAMHPTSGRAGLMITVADTGSGISSFDRPRIFQPFFTTKGDSGQGLGLWISQGIVDRHRGLIRVRSRQDSARTGSIFSIFLPSDFEVLTDCAPPENLAERLRLSPVMPVLSAVSPVAVPVALLSN